MVVAPGDGAGDPYVEHDELVAEPSLRFRFAHGGQLIEQLTGADSSLLAWQLGVAVGEC